MNIDGDGKTGQAIIDKMLATYSALRSYQDCGYAVDVKYAGTGDERIIRTDFTTSFKRADRQLFRFQWQYPSTDEPSGVWAAAIWSNGEAVFGHYPATGTKIEESIGWAIGGGAGALSYGIAHKGLFLLMPELAADCAHHLRLDGFELKNIEDVDGQECHHLQRVVASRTRSVQNSELWISAHRFALLKVRETDIVDYVRSDLWHEKGGDVDPVEYERMVELKRKISRKFSEHLIQKYIQEHGNIEDWRRRSFELSSEPCQTITETFYTSVSFNCPITDEAAAFGDRF
jgi:hypothetical protein